MKNKINETRALLMLSVDMKICQKTCFYSQDIKVYTHMIRVNNCCYYLYTSTAETVSYIGTYHTRSKQHLNSRLQYVWW